MAQRNGYVSEETVARMEESGNNGERSVEWVRTEKKMDDCNRDLRMETFHCD